MNIKEALRRTLAKKELDRLRRAFDIIGTIAIVDIPPELRGKQRIIAQAVLAQNPHLRTVLKKGSAYGGKYRTHKLVWIAGKRTKETEHRESGARFRVHVEKCYFSPRLGSERLRIAKQIRKGERVLCMFSGVGPYPIIFAKHSPAKELVGVEINPSAHRYAQENVVLNKVQGRVRLFKGDARKVMSGWRRKFDRITMPLPMSANEFLKDALRVGKKGTTIHLYGFAPEDDLRMPAREALNTAKGLRRKVRVLRVVKCGAYAPRVFRVCTDLRMA